MSKKSRISKIKISENIGKKLDKLKNDDEVKNIYKPKDVGNSNFVDLIGEDVFYGENTSKRGKKGFNGLVIFIVLIVVIAGGYCFLNFVKNLLI